MADKDLSTLRADGLIYAGAIGVALVAALALVVRLEVLTVALVAYAVLVVLMLGALPAHLPQTRFGAANALTLGRGAAVCALTGFLAGPMDAALLWVASLLSFICLALDGVDGLLARRFATASPFGARFDMEVDAALMLVLGLLLVASDTVGAWVLLIGLARYLFVAAGWLAPALRAPLPYSERRRMVCVFQGVALAVALIPDLPSDVASHTAAAGLLATVWSFGVDILYLLRATRAPADPGVRL